MDEARAKELLTAERRRLELAAVRHHACRAGGA